MNRGLIAGIGAIALLGVGGFIVSQNLQPTEEKEFRYEAIKKGEVLRSTSSPGVLQPLTRVDVRSKAGGTVTRLLVEEGTVIKTGDLLAVIDPRDTRALFDQASADVLAAQARVAQAQSNTQLTQETTATAVRDAEVRVELARVALERAREEARVAPMRSQGEVAGAQASVEAQRQALEQLTRVEQPQRRADAEAALNRARIDRNNAQTDLERQRELFALGYVARSAVERAESTKAAAEASYRTASQRLETLAGSFEIEVREARARLRQAEEQLRIANANRSRVAQAQRDLEQAEKALTQAKIAREQAQSNRINVQVRKSDVQSAQAATVRSRVAARNAQEQLDSTSVRAPRAGVVTLKYLEEGTIVPAATSAFAQGTSIVQIADTTRMFVECSVDEADIASVRIDQPVRVTIEAYPGRPLNGVVRKVFPAAETATGVTSIKVRVEITELDKLEAQKIILRPGMNATCEFIQFQKGDALILPGPAIRREGEQAYVLIKTGDPKKPERRNVTLGEQGNEGFEVLEGLKEGDEVVIAEIDLAQMRDRLQRMQQAEQGGGFGAQRQGGPSRSRAGGGPGGGGGGGGGGGR